jgi:hypothetical protein
MFIEDRDLIILRSSGAKCAVRRLDLSVHCAPLERVTVSAVHSINIWLLRSQKTTSCFAIVNIYPRGFARM